jgi:CRISPR-associated protein Csm4
VKVLHYRLYPASGWATEWQADTLLGLLACVYGRARGAGALEEHFLRPWREGGPLFVLSDAFPGDLLPAPACLGLWDWPEAETKLAKRTRWLTPEGFRDIQWGRKPRLPSPALKPLRKTVKMRNSLSRLTDTTTDSGSLFGVPSTALETDCAYLSLYCRAEPEGQKILDEAFGLLAEAGYGADASAGQGQFELRGPPEEAGWIEGGGGAGGWVSLSTFQPAEGDPQQGFWQSFVKYGKLGPDFGVENVFKRPQWMLRAGACFRVPEGPREWYGRAIRDADLLPEATRAALAGRHAAPVHPAFALAVPLKWVEYYE